MPITFPALPWRPDNGADLTPATATPDASDGKLQAAWDAVRAALDGIPTWTWVLAIGAFTVVTILCLPMLRAQAFKAGARDSKKQLTDEDRKDRRLLIAALIPAVGFWLAVLIGSGRGLIAFGRDDLNWVGGWEFLVPFTLDGVAISFGLLAFRAVRKQRSPDRAVRIAGGAMIASSAINFLHEVGGSKLGAAYLAILSLLGMLIFDELLAQFEEGAAYITRQYPKFGLRWITWPTNTVCAWFAWRNHPPEQDVDATIRVAVANLDRVRGNKARTRAESVDQPTWWVRINPVLRTGQLATALTEQRTAAASERAQIAVLRADVERLQEAHRKTVEEMAEQYRVSLEQQRSETAEQLERMRAEHAAHVSRIRDKAVTAPSGAPARSSAKTAPPATGAEQRLSNDEAVELMLRTHPEPGYEWGAREVRELTGAGFGRVPKLIAAAREHHARSADTGTRSTSDDDAKERSA